MTKVTITNEIVKTAKGKNGQVSLYRNRIEITRKGFGGFLHHGFDGTKIIFLKSVSGLQFKESGKLTAGYIQFIFTGSQESKAGLVDAVKDENTVLFEGKDEQDFIEIKNFIINCIQ